MNFKKIIVTCLFIVFVSVYSASFALSKYGSSGEEVKQIQSRLKEWGYYNDNIDGIYGSKTFEAVKRFQKNSFFLKLSKFDG